MKVSRNNIQTLKDTLSKDWHRLSVCFGKAVDYLRLNFSVVSRDYLYSDYMLAMLALFYYWNRSGPSIRQKQEIRKWFWATAVGSRYSGSKFNTCLPEDLRFFYRLAMNGAARFSYAPQADKIDVRKSLYAARTGITTASFCMLMLRRPVADHFPMVAGSVVVALGVAGNPGAVELVSQCLRGNPAGFDFHPEGAGKGVNSGAGNPLAGHPVNFCLNVAHKSGVGAEADGDFFVGHARCQQQADLLAFVEAGAFEDLGGAHGSVWLLRV